MSMLFKFKENVRALKELGMWKHLDYSFPRFQPLPSALTSSTGPFLPRPAVCLTMAVPVLPFALLMLHYRSSLSFSEKYGH
jgi:hypothetical protein